MKEMYQKKLLKHIERMTENQALFLLALLDNLFGKVGEANE